MYLHNSLRGDAYFQREWQVFSNGKCYHQDILVAETVPGSDILESVVTDTNANIYRFKVYILDSDYIR